MVDNIVEEIHAIRDKLYEECGGDSEKIAAYYLKLQEESQNKPRPATAEPQQIDPQTHL
jgi:hypothetical protein